MRQFKKVGNASSDDSLAMHSTHSTKLESLTPSFESLNKNPPSPSIFLTGYELPRTSTEQIATLKTEDNIDIVEERKLEICSDDDADPSSKKETRRNKRKSLLPQRAVLGQRNDNLAGSSESSQDAEDAEKFFSTLNSGFTANIADETNPILNELFIVDGSDVILDLSSADDILSQFNDDLEKESGNKLDEETIVSFKKEWKAHWGVKCNMCEKVFPSRTDFDNHYRESYNLIPVYTCTVCNKTCEKYSTFRSHCYRHITEGRYKCEICSKGFSLQSVLKVHIMAKHTKAKPYMCEECGRGFVTRPGLKVHLKKHKTSQKEYYPCVECGKVLHTRGGLTSHMNVHRLGRRFMCDVCGKTFTQKVNMQQHVKQHTGDKPYGCDQCGKTFAERSHLARHHSCHSDERPFKCDVCGKWYKTERCLKVHSLVHADKRPFVCCHCNKGFLSRTKLMQHSNIHTGERPYQCKYCGRSFTNFPNWLKHIRRRHKVDHRTGQALVPFRVEDSVFKEEDSVDGESPSGFVEIRPAPPTVEQLLAELVKVEGTGGWEQELVVMDEVNGVNGTMDVTGFGNLLPLPMPPSSQLPITATIIDHNLLASLPIQLTDINGQFIQTPLL